MATLFNNTEITNAFFNGTELDKIYFNGILVFEKGGKYKRRIMVGDNLSNKIIYIDKFPAGYAKEASSFESWDRFIHMEYNDSYPSSNYFAIGQLKDKNGVSVLDNQFGVLTYIGMPGAVDQYIYRGTYDGNTVTNESQLSEMTIDSIWEEYTPIVSDIHENISAYRYFFIEDENIRPLEVGDILDTGTKLYFTIPDNINLDFNNLGNYYFGYVIRVGDSDGFPAGIWMFVKDGRAASNEYQISIQTEYWDTELVEIYSYNTDNNTVNTNISEYTLTQYLGVVESTPETSSGSTSSEEIEKKLFNNIFVDITTLGV